MNISKKTTLYERNDSTIDVYKSLTQDLKARYSGYSGSSYSSGYSGSSKTKYKSTYKPKYKNDYNYKTSVQVYVKPATYY